MVIDQLNAKRGTTLFPIDSFNGKIGDIINVEDNTFHFAKQKDLVGETSVATTNAVKEPIISFGVSGNTKQALLPSEYQQVEYIESDGKSYIDTGVKGSSNVKMQFDGAFKMVSGYTFFTGSREAVRTKEISFVTDTTFICRFGTEEYFATSTSEKISVEISKDGVFINNELKKSFTQTDWSNDYNIAIFAVNNLGTIRYGKGHKPSRYRIYDGNTLVRDFIPCYRIADNVIGMYDLVNGVFYENQGTGTFLKGANAPTPDIPIPIENAQGVKNLLPYPYADGDSKTSAGVAFTVNSQGEFTLNGAGDWASYSILKKENSVEIVEANRGKTLLLTRTLFLNGLYTVLTVYKSDGTSFTELLTKPYLFEITEDVTQFSVGLRNRYINRYKDTKFYVILAEKEPTLLTQRNSNLFEFNVSPYVTGYSTTTTQGITFTVQDDGGIKVQGTTGSSYTCFVFAPEVTMGKFGAGTYTLSGTGLEQGVCTLEFRKQNVNGASVPVGNSSAFPKTATIADGETLGRFAIIVNSNTTVDTVVYPMLNYGNEALPFTKGTRNDVLLPPSVTKADGTVVDLRMGKQGSKADKLLVNRTNGTVTYEQWVKTEPMPISTATWGIPTTANQVNTIRATTNITNSFSNIDLSQRFLVNKFSEVFDATIDEQGFYQPEGSLSQWLALRIDRGLLSAQNSAGIKAWLQAQQDEGDPVLIHYALKTPITHDITDTELGEKLLGLATEYGVNNFEISSELPVTSLELSYWEQITP